MLLGALAGTAQAQTVTGPRHGNVTALTSPAKTGTKGFAVLVMADGGVWRGRLPMPEGRARHGTVT